MKPRKLVQWLGALVFLAVAIPRLQVLTLENVAIVAGVLLAIVVAHQLVPE